MWLLDYSPVGERVGKMVMVFPLGKLVYGYSLLGEGGLHAYSPLGERVGDIVMVIPLGKLFMVSPCWGRGWGCMITTPLARIGG